VLDPDINVATIELLARQGVEVVVPPAQGCCGGLSWHTGDQAAAQAFARRNLEAFPADVDAIVTNAAGCGSTLHEYPLVLAGTPVEARARELAARAVDVSVFLLRLGLREVPPARSSILRVAYHDACHLANAQGVRAEPRDQLRAIPGVELCELPDAHLCCGSAGSYNIDQPEIAASLGEQKARAAMATGADVIATGNIGCLTQLKVHLARLGSHLRVRHTAQILRDAFAER
jgi:glycolate oxidase iron-sulfur subunit